MSLYGPTFYVTIVDLCIIFQCKLYISCIISCGNKIVSNCFNCFVSFGGQDNLSSSLLIKVKHVILLSESL